MMRGIVRICDGPSGVPELHADAVQGRAGDAAGVPHPVCDRAALRRDADRTLHPGWFQTRTALILGALMIAGLTFGTMLRQDFTIAWLQLDYADRVLHPDRAALVEPDFGGRDDGRRQGVNSCSSARLDDVNAGRQPRMKRRLLVALSPRRSSPSMRPDTSGPGGGVIACRGSRATEGARGKSAARAIPAAASACAAGGASHPSADGVKSKARARAAAGQTPAVDAAPAPDVVPEPAAPAPSPAITEHRTSTSPVRAGSSGASGGSAIQGRHAPRLGLLPPRRHPSIGRRRSRPDHVGHDRAVL